jgi:hypothetical protein
LLAAVEARPETWGGGAAIGAVLVLQQQIGLAAVAMDDALAALIFDARAGWGRWSASSRRCRPLGQEGPCDDFAP